MWFFTIQSACESRGIFCFLMSVLRNQQGLRAEVSLLDAQVGSGVL